MQSLSKHLNISSKALRKAPQGQLDEPVAVVQHLGEAEVCSKGAFFGFGFKGLGFRGLRFRVKVLGFRVWGLGPLLEALRVPGVFGLRVCWVLGVYGVLGVRAFKVWGSGWIGAWGPRQSRFSVRRPPPPCYTLQARPGPNMLNPCDCAYFSHMAAPKPSTGTRISSQTHPKHTRSL